MKIFDSHAHYDDERFDETRAEVIEKIHANGVQRVVNVGSSLKTSKTSIELAEKYDFFYAAVGVHPENVDDMANPDWLSEVERMYSRKKAVAVGEIGLDYYYGSETRIEQIKCFEAQMSLAEKLGARVIIHDRDAHGDTLDIIKKFPKVTGVVHSFSGSFEMVKEVMNLGYYISVNGVVTFKNARKIVDIISFLDEIHPEARNRILVETDCPYLTPVPFRGQTNESDYIAYTAEKCGELLGMSAQDFCELTYNNACRFYGLGASL